MAEKDPSQRIVITGMGMVSPLGLDVESSWQALIDGKHGIQNVRETALAGYSEDRIKVSLGAPVVGFDLITNPYFDTQEVRKEIKKWHLSAQFALEAGFQALNQAGLLIDGSLRVNHPDVNLDRFGVSIGSGIGGADTLGQIQRVIDAPENDKSRVRPSDILHVLPARVGEVPELAFGARAFADGVFAECATGVSNIHRAADELRLGTADIVLAGGTERGVTPLALAAFGATGAVNTSKDPFQASRPFNKDAGGLVMGEGAGLVVLETLEHARRRGAVVLAELVGYGRSADAYDATNPSGEGAERALKTALIRGGMTADDIERAYVNAHATSTGEADGKEINAVSHVFKPVQIVGISSTKSSTGHTLGAAGGIETIFSSLAIRDGIVPPSLKLEDPIEETEGWAMSPLAATRIEGGIDYAIKNSFGFGGLNNVLILKKFSED